MKPSPWKEVLAGMTGATTAIPVNIANGLIAFTPVGGDPIAGAVAGVAATMVAGAILGTFSASVPMALTTSSSISIAIAGTLSLILAATSTTDPAARLGLAVAATAAMALIAALFIAALALLRLGRLALFVPYPVLAGFLNGTALLLAVGQLGPIFGQQGGHLPALADIRPLAPLVVLAGLAAIILPMPGRLARIPALVRGLAAAWALDAALRTAGLALLLGPLLGTPPDLAAMAHNLTLGLAAFPTIPWLHVAPTLTIGAATIAVLATIDTLGTASALRERGLPRADPNRDLAALAAATAVSAFAGAHPGSGSVTGTNALMLAGGRGRLSTIARAAGVFAAVALLGSVLARIPQAAIAAVILGLAWALADATLLRALATPHARHRVADALVMAAVIATAIFVSLAAAVAAGLLLATLLFTASMARGIVRRAIRNPVGRSRTRRPAWATNHLLAAGDAIELVELEGALFFGSAETMALHVETAASPLVVLDLSRITRIDLSGARQLLRLIRRPPPGTTILLAPLCPGLPAHDDLNTLGILSQIPPGSRFDAVETALGHAEEILLAPHAPPAELEHDPAAILAALGVAAPIAARLVQAMTPVAIPEGASLVRQNDPPDAMFVIVSGAADITLPRSTGRLRLATLVSGTLVGEMAFLTGHVRTADVWARTPLRCLRLDRDAMTRLEHDDPLGAAALTLAVAMQLDTNLRTMNTAMLAWSQ